MASLLVTVVLVIIVVGIVGGGAILLSAAHQRRDAAFVSAGTRSGMSFDAVAPADFSIAPITGFRLITQGRPIPITCTVAWHWGPALRLPSFRAHPEGVAHAIGGMIGYADVDLPAQPYFSDSYVLLCDDAGRRLVEGPIAGFLERLHADTVDVAVEGAGNHALFYSWERKVAGGDVQEFVDHAVTFFRLLHAR